MSLSNSCSPVNKLIFHVDLNSYFASLLQQENPALRGRPVGVVKDAGRTCLIAVSKEAKQLGLRTGDSLSKGQRLAKDLVLVPTPFERILDATKRLQGVFEQFLPSSEIEIFSLDEAFLDFSQARRMYPDAQHLAQSLQQAILQELGCCVTSTVGISWNRFLAKIAGETAPPASVAWITNENLHQKLVTTAFKDACGVGPRLEKKLRAIGVDNLYALRLVDDELLQRQVGPYWVNQLRRMSQGQEPDLLQRLGEPVKSMKSVGRSLTGYQPWHTEAEIEAVLYNLVAEVAHKARQMRLQGRHVWVAMWGELSQGGGWQRLQCSHYSQPGQFWQSRRTLKYYLNQTQGTWQVVQQLYQVGRSENPWPVIKMAVRLEQLRPDIQTPRIIWPTWQRQQQLEEAVDQLSEKYGLFTVFSGKMARGLGKKNNLIRPEVTGFLGDKAYQLGLS